MQHTIAVKHLSLLARLAAFLGRDREAGPGDREAGPDREAAPLADRAALRTYEQAGLGFFA